MIHDRLQNTIGFICPSSVVVCLYTKGAQILEIIANLHIYYDTIDIMNNKILCSDGL